MTASGPDGGVLTLGAVLAGGRSRRMGADKALVPVGGVAMARRVADALAGGGCHRVVAVGGDARGLGGLGIHVLPDAWPGEGPLGAIAVAMGEARDEGASVLVAACDLPWLDAATVRVLRSAASASGATVVCAHSTRREPLCSLWTPASFDAVGSAFARGARAVQSVLDELAVVDVDVDPAALRNANEPTDLPGGRLPT